jgi:hypothetical protein
MFRLRLLAVGIAGFALLGVAGSSGGLEERIAGAALAPYRDELLRDAPALCTDLTSAAAATLVRGAPPGASCEQVVQQIFNATAPLPVARSLGLSLRAGTSHLKISERRALGTFSLTASETTEQDGAPATAIVSLGTYRLGLEEVAGRWLVSSPARLAAVPDCRLNPPGRCHPGSEDLLFTLGAPVGVVPGVSIPIPPAVRRAGGREQHQFVAGRAVLAQSGCLACHRIGDSGNPGPGQNLTRVGARLSSPEIERVLRSPRAPMPSFKDLAAKRMRDLVRFLSLLRS